MSETKFTPGPWYIRKTGKHWNNAELDNIEICYGKDDECICDTVYQDSDARLIAAAPDMYEALKEVVRYTAPGGARTITEAMESIKWYERVKEQINAALAKAEGSI